MPGSGVATDGEGGGVSVPPPGPLLPEAATAQSAGVASTMLSSRVTEASSDMTLPHPMVAPGIERATGLRHDGSQGGNLWWSRESPRR